MGIRWVPGCCGKATLPQLACSPAPQLCACLCACPPVATTTYPSISCAVLLPAMPQGPCTRCDVGILSNSGLCLPGAYTFTYSVTTADGAASANATRVVYVYQSAVLALDFKLRSGMANGTAAGELAAALQNSSQVEVQDAVAAFMDSLGQDAGELDASNVVVSGAAVVQNGVQDYDVVVHISAHLYRPSVVRHSQLQAASSASGTMPASNGAARRLLQTSAGVAGRPLPSSVAVAQEAHALGRPTQTVPLPLSGLQAATEQVAALVRQAALDVRQLHQLSQGQTLSTADDAPRRWHPWMGGAATAEESQACQLTPNMLAADVQGSCSLGFQAPWTSCHTVTTHTGRRLMQSSSSSWSSLAQSIGSNTGSTVTTTTQGQQQVDEIAVSIQ